MWEEGDHIEGEIEYNTDLIRPETIKRLKAHFTGLIENLTEDPETAAGLATQGDAGA